MCIRDSSQPIQEPGFHWANLPRGRALSIGRYHSPTGAHLPGGGLWEDCSSQAPEGAWPGRSHEFRPLSPSGARNPVPVWPVQFMPQTGLLSGEMETATVIVIPKPGKNSSRVENLRPISLLSATSKVFEWLIQRRIRDHLGRLDVLIRCV